MIKLYSNSETALKINDLSSSSEDISNLLDEIIKDMSKMTMILDITELSYGHRALVREIKGKYFQQQYKENL